MGDLSTIPNAELIDDYWASVMDRDTWQRLLPGTESLKQIARMQKRINGNQRIIDIITAEMQRRGLISSSL